MDKNFPTDAHVHAVYRSIVAAGEEGMRTVDLVNTMDIGDSALNSALDLLKHLSLVEPDTSGTFHAADKSGSGKVAKIDMTYLYQRRLRDQSRLDRIIRYGQDKLCRRRQILNYFGQELEDNCAGCDVCHPRVNSSPGTDFCSGATADSADVLILAVTEELHGSSGRTITAATLMGSKSKRIIERGLNESKFWGTLKSKSEDSILARIDDLMDNGYLESSGGPYPKISLTHSGKRHLERLICTK